MLDIINSSKIAREVLSLMDSARSANATRTSNQFIVKDKYKNRFFVKIIVESEDWFTSIRRNKLYNIHKEIDTMEKAIKKEV